LEKQSFQIKVSSQYHHHFPYGVVVRKVERRALDYRKVEQPCHGIMYAVSEWICQNVVSTYYVYDGSSKRKKKAPRELPRGGVGGRVTELCFSIGIMMWELLTWKIPFGQTIEPAAMMACMLRGKGLDIPALNELPGPEPASAFTGLNRYIQLMNQCWSQDPKERPIMAEVASALRELLTDLLSTTDSNVLPAGGVAAGVVPSNEVTECVVCLDQKAVTALSHHNSNQSSTAHMCCCAECAENLQSRRLPCPLCRHPIDGTVRVY